MKTHRAFHLLVVDDDPLIHQSLKLCISAPWKIISVSKKELVPYTTFFHAAMVDMHLTPGSKNPEGVAVIDRLVKHNPQLEVVAMSGDLDRELMEKCLKAGAQRFLAKPLQPEEVLLVLNKIEAYWSIRNLDPQGKSISWIGSGPISQKTKKAIADLKGETKTILIEGERVPAKKSPPASSINKRTNALSSPLIFRAFRKIFLSPNFLVTSKAPSRVPIKIKSAWRKQRTAEIFSGRDRSPAPDPASEAIEILGIRRSSQGRLKRSFSRSSPA